MHAFIGDSPEIEYLAGRAVLKVSPKHRHGVVQGTIWAIVSDLGGSYGTTATEWRFRLADGEGKTHLVPDVAFLSYEHWHQLSVDDQQEPPGAPDVAVEIRSPDDREPDVMWKIRAYLDAGTALVLDVFPEERRITAYAESGRREFTVGTTFAHDAVPWLCFAVADAFAKLEPTE